jgi:membrane AbrB-like protein
MKKMARARILATTLVLAAVGAALASWASLPAPFITGSAIAVTLGGLCGVNVDVPVLLRNACFVVIGAIMGSGVTPEVIRSASVWPLSIIVLAISIAATMWMGNRMLRQYFLLDRTTAVLSSAPGHLSFVLGLGAQTGGNLPTIGLIQSIRLLLLTLIVPIVISIEGYGTAPAALPPAAVMAHGPFVALLATCAAFGAALHVLHVPAGLLVGSMAISALGHISGLVEGTVPQDLSIPAYVIMGGLIGSRFSGVSIAELARNAGAGLVTTAIASVIAAFAATVASFLTGIPITSVLVAFAPGGVETMSAIALAVDADPAYVAAHHVMRLFMLTALIPLFMRQTKRERSKSGLDGTG